MLRKRSDSVKKVKVDIKGAKKAKVQWLLSYQDGMPNFTIRKFRIESGGKIPLHRHGWEHGICILEGEGIIEQRTALPYKWTIEEAKVDDIFYLEKNIFHRFSNPYTADFVFLCIIPNTGDTRRFKYYESEDLEREGKVACKDCIYVTGKNNEGCTAAYAIRLQPEDCYWTVRGSIIGCKHGDRKDDNKNKE